MSKPHFKGTASVSLIDSALLKIRMDTGFQRVEHEKYI
jgi:hypothetical protein